MFLLRLSYQMYYIYHYMALKVSSIIANLHPKDAQKIRQKINDHPGEFFLK